MLYKDSRLMRYKDKLSENLGWQININHMIWPIWSVYMEKDPYNMDHIYLSTKENLRVMPASKQDCFGIPIF